MSRKLSTISLVLLAVAMGSVIQAMGWAQTSNYALVRALENGTAQIDEYSWETRDSSYYKGHYYSVKAPGMAFLVLPFSMALKAVGADRLSVVMIEGARRGNALRWARAGVPSGMYANSLKLAQETRARITNYTPFVWMLSLLACVLPALAMMFIIRAIGDELAPGYGTLAAWATGAGTLILPFSTLFFSHVISAVMVLGAFALLWRERKAPTHLGLIFAAGLLGGFSITTEYPLGLAAVIIGVYALARFGLSEKGELLRRSGAYAAGGILGVLPLAVYNKLAFGSVTYFSYKNAIAEQGTSGHAVLGLNDGGFFGITDPKLSNTFDLLFSAKGLFMLSPVLLMALFGLVLMWRGGRRAEVGVIAAIFISYVAYNSGYWLPFGGGSPGPRFLVPVIPFLGLALAPAFKKLPATALALTLPSMLVMATATATLPMIGNGDVGIWPRLVQMVNFEQTWINAFGVDNKWWGILPFVIPLIASLVCVIVATVPMRIKARDVSIATGAVVAWAIVAMSVPRHPVPATPGNDHTYAPFVLVLAALALALVAGTSLAERATFARRRRQVVDDQVALDSA
ncbi:MAG: hypothetical protein JHD02_02635 [Thermoleophilaceae bacterium]|nr:hypothetical protein [Thermoleophilaceae bacterium]